MSLRRSSCGCLLVPVYKFDVSVLIDPDSCTAERAVTDRCPADLVAGRTAVGTFNCNELRFELVLILLAVEIGLFLCRNRLRLLSFSLLLRSLLLCNGDLTLFADIRDYA